MNIKTILIIVAAQTLLIVGTVAGTWMLFQSTSNSTPEMLTESADAEGEVTAKAPKDLKDPLYFSVEPAFVVNLKGDGASRFLQVQVDLMSRDADDIEKLEKYHARIKNDLLMLFGSVSREELLAAEGKTKLQQSALQAVNTVLKEESGKGSVEAVYFSKFVIQ